MFNPISFYFCIDSVGGRIRVGVDCCFYTVSFCFDMYGEGCEIAVLNTILFCIDSILQFHRVHIPRGTQRPRGFPGQRCHASLLCPIGDGDAWHPLDQGRKTSDPG